MEPEVEETDSREPEKHARRLPLHAAGPRPPPSGVSLEAGLGHSRRQLSACSVTRLAGRTVQFEERVARAGGTVRKTGEISRMPECRRGPRIPALAFLRAGEELFSEPPRSVDESGLRQQLAQQKVANY